MKIYVYGSAEEKRRIEEVVSVLPDYAYRSFRFDGCEDYDRFIGSLCEAMPDLVIVTSDGADGMEGVIAAKNLLPGVPVMWLSDDKGFGAQSYRLGCAFFHPKPITSEALAQAFRKGIQ